MFYVLFLLPPAYVRSGANIHPVHTWSSIAGADGSNKQRTNRNLLIANRTLNLQDVFSLFWSHILSVTYTLSQILNSVMTCLYWDLITISLMIPRQELVRHLDKAPMMQEPIVISRSRRAKGPVIADIRVTVLVEAGSRLGPSQLCHLTPPTLFEWSPIISNYPE